ncbi:MAG: Gfo/Idh/MocA family oxidoreductase [Spirochaetaceae bacterium]
MNVGIIGTGNISDIYLKNFTGMFKDRVNLLGCADLVKEKADEAAEKYNLKKRYSSVEELLNDDEIDIVVNLTIPLAHYDVNRMAIEYGKHVYVEKPLCGTVEEAKALLELADKKKLRVGGAPDTFLGAGIQTCRKLIDDDWIGRPIAATAFMTCPGHESWHPAPEFYYKKGGGPMFDMGPYYLTALVNLIGPVNSVMGSTSMVRKERTITSSEKYGEIIKVEVPTHVTGLLNFENGVIGTIITSFDVWDANLPRIEIYGTKGSLSVPDPNSFGGPVLLKRFDDTQWREMPLSHSFPENSRGLGVVDMAEAIEAGEEHRASGVLTSHVLEIMHGIHISSDKETMYKMESKGVKPKAL